MHVRSSSRATRPRRLLRARRVGALVATASLTTIGLAVAPAASASVHQARAAAPPPLSLQRPLDLPRAVRLPRGVRQACPLSDQAGVMQCALLIRSGLRRDRGVNHDQAPAGYGPTQLQSAYNLTSAASTGGTGETVAVVSAYSDPNAASDLAAYRAEYDLPACSPTTGGPGCLTVENEEGQSTPLPTANSEWAMTESVDLDMVSAICPNCAILLIEANSNSISDLGTAENTAAASGAGFIANSWNGPEFSSEGYYDNEYFDHPGVAITVASGNAGYGTTWPSTSQFVTTVGGTTLTQDSSVTRGWTETAWNDSAGATGSGCSLAEPKPSWQTIDDSAPDGCLNRTENDVAAVADPETGVATYDSYDTTTPWSVVGGTSVSAPIVAGVYALAGTPTAGTYPASYPYQNYLNEDGSGLYPVTSGSNGSCEPSRQYLCNAAVGYGETSYNGPAGLGTPDGTAAFANSATGNVVTITDPGTQDEEAGKPVYLALSGADSAGLALTYSATGLPSGLSIGASSGLITGTLGSSASTNTVTVTAQDSTGASGSVTFTMVVVKSLTTDYDAVSGQVHVDLDNLCLDTPDGTNAGEPVTIWQCDSSSAEKWTFEPDGGPGQPDGGTPQSGTLTIGGKCMDLKNGSDKPETYVVLEDCDGKSSQQWMIVGSDGQFWNTYSRYCLADPGGSTTNGHQVWVWDCDGGTNQAWTLPASPVQSGVTGMCMDDNHDVTTNGNKVQVWDCNGKQAQQWTDEPNETIQRGGACLTVTDSSMLDGATVVLDTCNTNNNTNGNQRWIVSGGELINVNSGRCLSDPGNSNTDGTALVQEDCYAESGQIWALT
jgi:hypothetical protein